ncbi:alpha/beta fold hydrolase [Nigerium massiliense]|uniref:alpha/beta fold hydrolase n=1 Tax=Nigerium massiliense TaxID=1522317 RepID=UPI00058E77E7|nr:alpha/beta hydrolase [Nigerium massiliense]
MTDAFPPAHRAEVALPWGPVSFLAWGEPGHGETVVLLHGGGVDNAALSWGSLGPALAAAGHHVVAPDHPGYGHSPAAPWPSTVANLVGYVDAFVAAAGVRDRYVLGGISLGGALTLGQALDHPDGIVGLLLFAPYGIVPSMGRGWTAPLTQALSWASIQSGILDRLTPLFLRSRRLTRASLGNLIGDPARRSEQLLDAVMAAGASPAAGRAFAEFQRDEVGPRRNRTDFSARLPEIGVPALFVQGGLDPGVPAFRARAAADAMPRGRLLLVDGAAHWVQRDRPDVVEPAVAGFVASLGRR